MEKIADDSDAVKRSRKTSLCGLMLRKGLSVHSESPRECHRLVEPQVCPYTLSNTVVQEETT